MTINCEQKSQQEALSHEEAYLQIYNRRLGSTPSLKQSCSKKFYLTTPLAEVVSLTGEESEVGLLAYSRTNARVRICEGSRTDHWVKSPCLRWMRARHPRGREEWRRGARRARRGPVDVVHHGPGRRKRTCRRLGASPTKALRCAVSTERCSSLLRGRCVEDRRQESEPTTKKKTATWSHC